MYEDQVAREGFELLDEGEKESWRSSSWPLTSVDASAGEGGATRPSALA